MTYISAFFLAFYVIVVLTTCVHIRPYKGGEDL